MKCKSGRSSAWLERYVRDVEVARSNRVAPISPQGFPLRFFHFLLRTPLSAPLTYYTFQ